MKHHVYTSLSGKCQQGKFLWTLLTCWVILKAPAWTIKFSELQIIGSGHCPEFALQKWRDFLGEAHSQQQENTRNVQPRVVHTWRIHFAAEIPSFSSHINIGLHHPKLLKLFPSWNMRVLCVLQIFFILRYLHCVSCFASVSSQKQSTHSKWMFWTFFLLHSPTAWHFLDLLTRGLGGKV